MISFDEWSDESTEEVNGYRLRLLTLTQGQVTVAEDKVAAIIPEHYLSLEQLAQALKTLGQVKAFEYLRDEIPAKLIAQSGDLGEIFVTEYIREKMDFEVPINKLRWRDHHEMAPRGEDVIGFQFSDNGDLLRLLKVEAKSQKRLNASTVRKAREKLDDYSGRPSPHGLSFIAKRLQELGRIDLFTAIIKTQSGKNITPDQVEHLIFVFSGDNLDNPLRAGLNGYRGRILQNNVGLKIGTHQEFIKNVFNKASGV